MTRQEKMITKKLGRPATGKGTLIGVRLQPTELGALDIWRQDQPQEISRPEAIRRLLSEALVRK